MNTNSDKGMASAILGRRPDPSTPTPKRLMEFARGLGLTWTRMLEAHEWHGDWSEVVEVQNHLFTDGVIRKHYFFFVNGKFSLFESHGSCYPKMILRLLKFAIEGAEDAD